MPITKAIANSAKVDILEDYIAGKTFNLALYNATPAAYDATSTAYSTTGEVTGTGYTAGGAALSNPNVVLDSGSAVLDFDDLTFSNSTITASGLAIYDGTTAGDPLLLVEPFTETSSVSGDFTIAFPAPTAAAGLLVAA